MSYFKQPGLPSAYDSNLLFDASIQNLFLGPTIHPDNWDNLAASVASFDRSFATTTHRVLLPSSVSFEFSPLEIDSELKKLILHHKKRLTFHRSCRGIESGLIDALFSICHSFYDQHPLFNLDEVEKQARNRYKNFSILSGIDSHLITPTDLPVELAFNAVGRFSAFCLAEEPSIDPDKLNIALIKCWVGWIGQRVNVSAYSFMSHIFHQLEQTPILKLVEGESSELVHFCLFGAFIASK